MLPILRLKSFSRRERSIRGTTLWRAAREFDIFFLKIIFIVYRYTIVHLSLVFLSLLFLVRAYKYRYATEISKVLKDPELDYKYFKALYRNQLFDDYSFDGRVAYEWNNAIVRSLIPPDSILEFGYQDG